MTYGVEVWGNTHKTKLVPISILQKRAIRMINRAEYREPTNPLFIKLDTLKFKDIVDLQTLTILYKAHHNLLPLCSQDLFRIKETKYELRNTGSFVNKKARVNCLEHCVSVKGAKLWNDCDKELKMCSSIQTFKKRFKTMTINKYKDEV